MRDRETRKEIRKRDGKHGTNEALALSCTTPTHVPASEVGKGGSLADRFL